MHRDLKPANIRSPNDSTVKVLEFELAKALDPARGDRRGSQSAAAAKRRFGVTPRMQDRLAAAAELADRRRAAN